MMNAIEILGSLLGGSGGSGNGADILSEILGGKGSPQPKQGGSRTQASNEPSSVSDLEDMLGIGKPAPRTNPTQAPTPQREPQRAPQSAPPATLPTDIFGQRRKAPSINLSVPKPAPLSKHDQAVLFIRAMINSAKIDGEINEEEQQNILSQVGDTSAETIQFLRTEFARPIDLQEFVASIPLGLESQIYAISIMAIKLDTKEEADYLRKLAQGLRISPDVCNEIHQQQQMPLIYQG
jgi:uncharacterized membrane protein YebE (DUF533 family)